MTMLTGLSMRNIALSILIICLSSLCISVKAQGSTGYRYFINEQQAKELLQEKIGDIRLYDFIARQYPLDDACDFRRNSYEFYDIDKKYVWTIDRWSRRVVAYTNRAEGEDERLNVPSYKSQPDEEGKRLIIHDADILIGRYCPGYLERNIEKRFIVMRDGTNWLEYIQYSPSGAAYDFNRFIFLYNIHTNHITSFDYFPNTKPNDGRLQPVIDRKRAQSIAEAYLRLKCKRTGMVWCSYIPPTDFEIARGQDFLIIEDALGIQRLVYRMRFYLNDDPTYKTPDDFFKQDPKPAISPDKVTRLDVDAVNSDVLFSGPRTAIDVNNWVKRPQVFVDTHQIYLSYLPQVIHREAYVRLDYLWGNPLWNGTISTAADGSITVQYPEATLVVKKPDVTVRRKDAVVYTGKVVETPDGGMYVHYSVIPLLTGDTVKWDEVYQVLKITTAPVGTNTAPH